MQFEQHLDVYSDIIYDAFLEADESPFDRASQETMDIIIKHMSEYGLSIPSNEQEMLIATGADNLGQLIITGVFTYYYELIDAHVIRYAIENGTKQAYKVIVSGYERLESYH